MDILEQAATVEQAVMRDKQFESAGDGCLCLNESNRILEASESFGRLVGWRAADLVGTSLVEWVDADLARWRKQVPATREWHDVVSLQGQLLRHGGGRRPIDARFFPVTRGGNAAVCLVVHTQVCATPRCGKS